MNNTPNGIPADVCAKFVSLAREVKERGFVRYSADAILHRIRWHYRIDRGERDFKCNDHWTSRLSRWAMDAHPDLDGLFETRALADERRAL